MSPIGVFIVILLVAQMSPTPRNRAEEQGHSRKNQESAIKIATPFPQPQVGTANVNHRSSEKKAKNTRHKASYVCRATAPEYLSQWVLVFIGAIGIIFGLKSLRLLRNQVKADIAAAYAARQSADIANQSLILLERARLYVSKFAFIPTERGDELNYSFEITNSGSTPGTIYERQMTYWPTREPLPEYPPSVGNPISDDLTIHARQTIPWSSETLHPIDVTKEMYIIGVIKYRDIFGGNQTTRFCARHIPWTNAEMITKAGYSTAT